jgi:hypothetical protein
MSKHIGRNQRWSRQSPSRYASELGIVQYQERAWYALLDYQTLSPDPTLMPAWNTHHVKLGPFKRPRNAMVALEREVTVLRNRYGPNLPLSKPEA